ncbi:MAG TPA: cob(I)yrinic acid a,c-diamide adenosyltransferase [Longimicrobiaceae bacterium]|nr:cob(I)yrinic acid a,c-diamide adenosyltransferase [Longimicrobiaceae bacterium]
MKIYTKTGDRGETGLFGGGRVAKDDIRVEAYGAVDELNSVLGMAAAALEAEDLMPIAEGIRGIQADLLTVGAHLATPTAAEGGRASANIPDLPVDRITELERWIDSSESELAPLRRFILPGGTEAAARLHHARTVCRRAERRAVTLARDADLADEIIIYLNRLSDLLFSLARLSNHRAARQDVEWVTG